MGVDYRAVLGYGYEAPEPREEHEDGWWELEMYYAKAMGPEVDMPEESWADYRAILQAFPCPVQYVEVGSKSYGGAWKGFLCVSESVRSADTYGDNPVHEIRTPDPVKAKKLIDGFLTLLGYEPPADEPSWLFGLCIS